MQLLGDGLSKGLLDSAYGSLVFSKYLSEDAVQVPVPWHLSLCTVAWSVDKLADERLYVLEVIDSFDPKDDELVPLARVSVLGVVPDSTVQVACEPYVVKLLPPIEGIDASVLAHHLPEPLFKEGALKDLAGKAAGHSLD